MNDLGLVHVYTGDGKGKTTSAVGLAVRAVGEGLRVGYASFHKRPEVYGYAEMESLRKLGVTVMNFAKGHPHLDRSIDEGVIRREVQEAMVELSQKVLTEGYDLLILDEILISVRDRYLEESVLLDFVQNKPKQMELVLTGRGVTPAVEALADYVSWIQKRKHPYDRGVMSRKGIEF
jgi:cob(I)alamin adenosyltransferase